MEGATPPLLSCVINMHIYICTYAHYAYLYVCIVQRFDGNSACIHDQTEQVRQFGAPVIAQYIRIVPVEWVGPMICFKMELYGCFVRGNSAIIHHTLYTV